MSSSKTIGKKLLSVLSSATLAASCLALVPTAPALTVEAAGTSSYIFHDTFESGTDDWSARGGCKAAVSSDAKYMGSRSLFISGRTASWNGGQKSLSTTTFVPGKSYAFSACFTNLTGSDPTEFKLTLQYSLNGTTSYDKIAQTFANRGEFVQLYNAEYTIPAGAADLVLVVETTDETCDFYVDEIIAAPAGTKIDGPTSKVVISKGVRRGDVDLDGDLTVLDLIELKRGMVRGFINSTAEKNADVDKSGVIDEDDVSALQSYLVGEITEFPVVNNHLSMKDFTDKVKSTIVEKEPDSANRSKSGVTYGQIQKKSYYSTTCNRQKDVNILLPPNYDPNKKYPVMYIMHGYYEGIDRMLTKGNADMHTREMIGNAIAEGAAKEMICVFPDVFSSPTLKACTGMDETNNQGYDNFINDLTKDLMPYMEKNYSILTGKDNTAITGFSMGGREALLIGMKRPDLFGYVGAICPAPGVTGSFNWSADNQPYFLMITGGSDDTVVYDNPKTYHSNFEKNGVPHIWHYVNGGYHGDNCIRAHLYNFFRIAFQN
ncbi:alpha/beta hydrolase-fold protein [Ruminococcus albus]|uniref:Glucuronoarabinoxylan endo-1,4-beta-xylanase n=1 Tax=Ruminococcus albus TaxID=1264 RepID=A0A1H7J3Z7_RUMAL|nr:alpha/beta hydrolase-fold protein [Ruminococcus albus]SEK69306.1 glucuronoarabinoxylan endo-1,4-beta-xylanase [Ruminococcus albus]